MKPHRAPKAEITHLDEPWIDALRTQGYTDICVRNDRVCALKHFNFTTAIVVKMTLIDYAYRYCFEHAHEARAALEAWDGQGHPGGPWIKCKGAGIDLLNPALA